MSEWDTRNFLWLSLGMIHDNKWQPGTPGIFTSVEIAVGAHFHLEHTSKTTVVSTSKTTMVSLLVTTSKVGAFNVRQHCTTGQQLSLSDHSLSDDKSGLRNQKRQTSTRVTGINSIHLPRSKLVNVIKIFQVFQIFKILSLCVTWCSFTKVRSIRQQWLPIATQNRQYRFIRCCLLNLVHPRLPFNRAN